MPARTSEFMTPGYAITSLLWAFPMVSFTLALVTDVIYWRTSYLMWSHFSSWLLFFGLVVGAVAAIFRILAMIFSARYRARLSWPSVVGWSLVLFLAFVNSFVHASDGWPAVVPNGLVLSALTVLVMLVTGWLGYLRFTHAGDRRYA